MRIVLDTNILARSVMHPAGLAFEVLRLASEPPHTLIASSFLLSELSRVLRYDRLRAIHGLSDDEIDRAVDRVRQRAPVFVDVSDQALESVVTTDPDDDPIIAAAIAARAEVICTRDRHLQRPDVQEYCTQRGVRILSDVELLDELRPPDPNSGSRS